MQSSAINEYLKYLSDFRRISPGRLKKNKDWLARIESALKKELTKASTGSEINAAIVQVAANRRIANNGGVQDDGTNMRFCLGQAVVCYFRWAHSEGILERNIYPKNPFPERVDHAPNHFNDSKKLTTIFKGDFDTSSQNLTGLSRNRWGREDKELRNRLIASIFIDTGMRVSELAKLKLSDYDPTDRLFHSYMTKVRAWKKPVVTDKTVALYKKWLEIRPDYQKESEWVFPGQKKGTHLTEKAIRQNLAIIGKRHKIRMNPHSFRHTCLSLMQENGAQDSEIMEQAGLKDPRVLKRYLHPTAGHMHSILEKVQRGVAALA